MSVDAEIKYAELKFDPLRRAESMMAKVAGMPYKDGAMMAVDQREALRDLVLLDIAKSLRQLVHAMDKPVTMAFRQEDLPPKEPAPADDYRDMR